MNLTLANEGRRKPAENWRRLWLKDMLLQFSKNKMDSNGKRVPMTLNETFRRLQDIFFDKTAKPSWQMLPSGSGATVNSYAAFRKAITIAIRFRGGDVADVTPALEHEPARRFKKYAIKRGNYFY
jgi:hypothetical protein